MVFTMFFYHWLVVARMINGCWLPVVTQFHHQTIGGSQASLRFVVATHLHEVVDAKLRALDASGLDGTGEGRVPMGTGSQQHLG